MTPVSARRSRSANAMVTWRVIPARSNRTMSRLGKPQGCHHAESASRELLPDMYPYVVADMLHYCRPAEGLWVALGSGDGGIGLELARQSRSTVVLIDPDAEALGKGARNPDRADAGLGIWLRFAKE